MNKIAVIILLCMSVSLSADPGKGEVGSRIELEKRVVKLEAQVSLLLDLLADVSRADDARGYDTLVFSGMNVQINNGTGTTDGATDGLGNLIVGYNAARDICPGPSDCNRRTGSHNLIIGAQSNYTSYGGMVAGHTNEISGTWASVTGGSGNVASGNVATVSGGGQNTASAALSSVAGGQSNLASSFHSSVSGGQGGVASGQSSSISGGANNTASGNFSSVSGGVLNVAFGKSSSISGGFDKNSGTELCWEGDTSEDC